MLRDGSPRLMAEPDPVRFKRREFLANAVRLAVAVAGATVFTGQGRAVSAPLDRHVMPLESAPHERTFMQWPAREEIYGKQRLAAVQDTIHAVARTIAAFEPVVMLARPDLADALRTRLGGYVEVWPIAADDLWCRDSGPTFVVSKSGTLAVADLGFNGWGRKPKSAVDSKIAARVAQRLQLPVIATGIVGEGGGVEIDGDGTAMAHESSWINTNRNTGSKAEIEAKLLAALGAEHMIWSKGLKGADITDYHIDALARFVAPGRVVIQLGKSIDRSDRWSVAAFATYEILKSARDARGRKLEIVVIAEPEQKKRRVRGDDFVASYVNYYVCNGAVISAHFGDDKADFDAAATLRELYPGRKVVSLDVDALGKAGGGIHCATQQQPRPLV